MVAEFLVQIIGSDTVMEMALFTRQSWPHHTTKQLPSFTKELNHKERTEEFTARS